MFITNHRGKMQKMQYIYLNVDVDIFFQQMT